jgi:hypothetical protein
MRKIQPTTFVLLGALIAGASGVLAPKAYGQWYYGPEFDARPVHFGLSGGVAVPTGSFSNDFNTGWNVGGNIAFPLGYKSPVWIQLDIDHSQFGANNAVLNAFDATNGWAAVNSATFNVVLNLVQSYGRRPAPITPYLIAGGGFYSRYIELSNYTYNGYCNGYYGCVGYGGSFYSRTDNVGGWDAGAGVRFVMRPVRLFIEARYNSAVTDNGNTGFVPIKVGVEW